MDILMIYWNTVWSHGQPEPVSFLADHSSAEERAFERRLHPSPAEVKRQSALHLAGRRWTIDRADTSQVPN